MPASTAFWGPRLRAMFEELLRTWTGEELVVRFDEPTGAWFFIGVHSTVLGPAMGGTTAEGLRRARRRVARRPAVVGGHDPEASCREPAVRRWQGGPRRAGGAAAGERGAAHDLAAVRIGGGFAGRHVRHRGRHEHRAGGHGRRGGANRVRPRALSRARRVRRPRTRHRAGGVPWHRRERAPRVRFAVAGGSHGAGPGRRRGGWTVDRTPPRCGRDACWCPTSTAPAPEPPPRRSAAG